MLVCCCSGEALHAVVHVRSFVLVINYWAAIYILYVVLIVSIATRSVYRCIARSTAQADEGQTQMCDSRFDTCFTPQGSITMGLFVVCIREKEKRTSGISSCQTKNSTRPEWMKNLLHLLQQSISLPFPIVLDLIHRRTP